MRDTYTQIAGVVVARLGGASPDGRPLVRWRDDPPRPVRTVWMESAPDWAACEGLRVVLGFEEGDEDRPILLGLLDEPPRAEEEAPRDREEAEGAPRVLRIAGEREVVIECGKAKISLRADGRVVIRGGDVLSRASGVNRIKGGSVRIN